MNSFRSVFQNDLENFITYKKALGYVYENQKAKLIKFDNYLYQHNIQSITKDVITTFLNSLEINRASKSTYASTIRQFCIYLNKQEIECYVLEEKLYTRGNETRDPHIYTEDEIKKIFQSIKDYYSKNNYKKDVLLVFFQLLYCTGLRVGECCNIKIENIDFNNNTIEILETKNHSDRVIVISDELMKSLIMINTKYNNDCQKNAPFFRKKNGRAFNRNDIYHIFRKLLYHARIPHTENGPTVHHFRYTFCVNSLKKIIDNNLDINTYIPILCTYLGHNSYSSLEYYLRLTNIISNDIREKTESYTKKIIRGLDDE